MLALRVRKNKAEEARLLLTELKLLDMEHRIIEHGDIVEIPIMRQPNAAEVEEMSGLGEIGQLSEIVSRERFFDPWKYILISIDLPPELHGYLPRRWELFGDVLIFKLAPELGHHKREVARAFAAVLGAKTVLEDTGGIVGQFREPVHEILYGKDTETLHVENGVKFCFDAAKLMFSSGNVDERIRMASVPKPGEIIVDMFAGIGYFTLPMAVHSGPEKILAYELNPRSHEYLKRNAELNGVRNIVEPHLADCRTAVEEIADRVLMGYVGTTHEFLPKALRILKPASEGGGILHYHETCPNALLPQRPTQRIHDAASAAGRTAEVLATHKIKSYAPGVTHVVLDVLIR